MPIPGFLLIPRAENVTAKEGVEMVIEQFDKSGCTEAEACSYLIEQVRKDKLKLFWTENSPEYPYGRSPNRLFLAGDNIFDIGGDSPIFLPGIPAARAVDEIDWGAGLLRRRVRYPKIVDREGKDIDAAALSDYERRRASSDIVWPEFEHDLPGDGTSPLAIIESNEREVRAALCEYFVKEWVVEELTYPFTIKRASLVAILDPVRVPLAEAAGIIANHRKVGIEAGFDTLIEAASTKRIRIYGTPEYKWQGDRIRARVWRKLGRGEAQFSTETSTGRSPSGSWSNPYVFRTDLERLLQELAGDRAEGSDTSIIEPGAATASRQDTHSEKAKLRRRIKKALEAETEQDPPRAQSKAGWLELMRQKFGADAVTDNLFDEAWQKADLPEAWRAPGRRT